MSNALHQETLAPFHIYFTCPHCQAVRQVPEQYIGQTGCCNVCGGRITITAPTLPLVAAGPRPKAWYRERSAYFDYCRDHYAQARAAFTATADDAYWQRAIQEAATCSDPAGQVARWERLVAEGIPWAVAFEHLIHHHVKERDYARAYYFCCLYFQGPGWRNPQCMGSSHTLLKTMRKLEKKLYPEP